MKKSLTKKFKKETGCRIEYVGQPHTERYIEWLEKRIKRQEKRRKIILKF